MAAQHRTSFRYTGAAMRNPLLTFSSLLVLIVLVAGCRPNSDSEPPADISGSYNFATFLDNNECVTLDFWQIFAFAEDNGNGMPVFVADFEQQGAELTAALQLADCSLTGDVVAGGAFALSGPCNDDSMDRDLFLNGTAELDGMGWEVEEGALVIDVHVSGDEGGAECSVTSTVQGSGSSGS